MQQYYSEMSNRRAADKRFMEEILPSQRPQWDTGGAQRESVLLEEAPDLELVNFYLSLGLEKIRLEGRTLQDTQIG